VYQSSNADGSETLEVIKKILSIVGEESKNVILNYIQERYQMDLNSLFTHRAEFINYLEEMLGDSAEIISARINQALVGYAIADGSAAGLGKNNNKNHYFEDPLCYICNRSFAPELMRQHLLLEHSREEVARHLAIIYVDDWKEELESKLESTATIRKLLCN
jgi:hypothetical protein